MYKARIKITSAKPDRSFTQLVEERIRGAGTTRANIAVVPAERGAQSPPILTPPAF